LDQTETTHTPTGVVLSTTDRNPELSQATAVATAKLRGGTFDHDDPSKLPEGVRNTKGQFVKGSSGNLAGRTRGVRSKITFDRLFVEDALREVLAKQSPKLLEKAIRMALEDGNDRIMRVLLDKLLSTPKHDDPGESRDNEIKVVIQSLKTSVEGGPKPTITITPPPENEANEAESARAPRSSPDSD
jgi:hypothetical protein